MREKILSLKKNPLYITLKSSFLAKLILIIGGLILAKYYGEHQYGVFNIYTGVSLMVGIFIAMGQEHHILLEKTLQGSKNSFTIINFLAIFLTILLIIFFSVFSFEKYIEPKVLILGILSGYFSFFYVCVSLCFSRIKFFKIVSRLNVLNSIFIFVLQILFLFSEYKNGLLWGAFWGSFCFYLYLLWLGKRFFVFPDFQWFKREFKQRINLLKFTYTSTLLNTLGQNLIFVLIPIFFSESFLGEYSLAIKILGVPMFVVIAGIGSVYYPKIAEIQRKKQKMLSYTLRIFYLSFLLTFVSFLLVNTLGMWVLDSFFGKDWERVSLIVFYYSLGFLARASLNPLLHIFVVIDKNYIELLYNIYLCFSLFIAILIGCFYGWEALCVSHSLLFLVGNSVLFLVIYRILKKRDFLVE